MKTTLSILKVFCTLLVINVFIDFIKKVNHILRYFFNEGGKSKLFDLVIPENWNNGIYYLLLLISLGLTIYVTLLAVDFRQVIFDFSKEKVFTKENSERLRKVGRGLIIYGSVIFFITFILSFSAAQYLDTYKMDYNDSVERINDLGYAFGGSIIKVLKIFVVALFVQFISFIVARGNELQEENDLTI